MAGAATQVLRALLDAAPASFAVLEHEVVAATRGAFAAAAEAEPDCGSALAVLDTVAGRSAALAAAVNARVLSYDEATAVQVGPALILPR